MERRLPAVGVHGLTAAIFGMIVCEGYEMFTISKKEIEWGGRPLIIETGRIARQADGAVLVTYGGTQVLCTAVAQRRPKSGIDFFPLTINYQEKNLCGGQNSWRFFQT